MQAPLAVHEVEARDFVVSWQKVEVHNGRGASATAAGPGAPRMPKVAADGPIVW